MALDDVCTIALNSGYERIEAPTGSWCCRLKFPISGFFYCGVAACVGLEVEMGLRKVFAALSVISALTAYPLSGYAGWFSPDTFEECKEKYFDQTKLMQGKRLVLWACRVWFSSSDAIKPEMKNVAQCVVKSAGDFYSIEAAQKVAHDCAKKYNSQGSFNAMYQILRREEIDAREEAAEARRKQEERQFRGPSTCIKIGNILHCD